MVHWGPCRHSHQSPIWSPRIHQLPWNNLSWRQPINRNIHLNFKKLFPLWKWLQWDWSFHTVANLSHKFSREAQPWKTTQQENFAFLQILSEGQWAFFGQVCFIAHLTLIMPATNAASKWTFIMMRRIKSYILAKQHGTGKGKPSNGAQHITRRCWMITTCILQPMALYKAVTFSRNMTFCTVCVSVLYDSKSHYSWVE